MNPPQNAAPLRSSSNLLRTAVPIRPPSSRHALADEVPSSNYQSNNMSSVGQLSSTGSSQPPRVSEPLKDLERWQESIQSYLQRGKNFRIPTIPSEALGPAAAGRTQARSSETAPSATDKSAEMVENRAFVQRLQPAERELYAGFQFATRSPSKVVANQGAGSRSTSSSAANSVAPTPLASADNDNDFMRYISPTENTPQVKPAPSSSSSSSQAITSSPLPLNLVQYHPSAAHASGRNPPEEDTLRVLRTALSERELDIVELKNQQKQLIVQIQTSSREWERLLSEKEEQVQEKEKRLVTVEKENKSKQSSIKKLQSIVSELQVRVAELASRTQNNETMAELKAQILQREAEMETLQRRLNESNAALQEHSDTIASLQVEVSKTVNLEAELMRIRGVSRELANASKPQLLDVISSQKAEILELARAIREMEGVKKELAASQEKVVHLQQESIGKMEENALLEKELEELQEEFARWKPNTLPPNATPGIFRKERDRYAEELDQTQLAVWRTARELESLLKAIKSRSSGEDLSVSMIVGRPAGEEAKQPSRGDLVDLPKELSSIQRLMQELRDMVTVQYAEDVGSGCAQQ